MQKIAQGLSDFFGQFIKRYSPAIVTLIIIAGAFFFYSNVIIGKNEQTIKERSFRGLNRIAGNIKQKIRNYSAYNSRNFLRQINKETFQYQIPEARITNIREEYGLTELKSDTANKNPRDTFSIRFDKEWQIIFNNPPETVKPADSTLFDRAGTSISEFVSPLLRRDLFSYYFVAYRDNVLYDELNLSNYKIAVPQSGLIVTDSTIKAKVIQYGFVNEVEVGGKRYKLFLQPFTAESNSPFVLGGYMPVEKYDDEKKYIPGNAIPWLILSLAIVILMFPLLKVFLMNRVEQLFSRNVLTSLMSVHLLGSILIIIMVNIYAYFILIRGKTDSDLINLAENIQKTFGDELKDAIAEIDSSENELINIVRTHPGKFSSRYLPDLYLASGDNDTMVYHVAGAEGRDEGVIADTTARLSKRYRYFENITWIDSNGQQAIRWTNNPFLASKGNVRQRDYFQAIMNNTQLLTDNGKDYYVAAVSSWTAQKKLVVVARPSGLKEKLKADTVAPMIPQEIKDTLSKEKVVTLSSPFRSVFNPILPYGFGFCIIDERSNVFFHYDDKRSLNENLLEECSDDREFSSLLSTGISGIFDAHYSGSNQRFYIEPVKGMPFHIVTFYDIENIWNQDLDVMSASSIMVLMNMGLILLLVLITRMFSLKSLSNQILFIWIEPKAHRRVAYNKAIAGFIATSVIMLLFCFFSGAADNLYKAGIPFCFTHILVGYTFYLYKKCDYEEKESPDKKMEFGRPLWVLTILYIFADILFIWQLDSGRWPYFFAQLTLLMVLYAITKWEFIRARFKQPVVQPEAEKLKLDAATYKRKYLISLFTFIMATGIVPTLVFFSLSFKEEQRLTVKYQQLDFVNNFLEKKPYLYYKGDSVWNLSYKFPFHYKSFADTLHRDTVTVGTETRQITQLGKLYSKIKPSFSSYAKRIEYLNESDESPGAFTWENTQSTDTLRLWFNVFKKNNIASNIKRISATKSLNYSICSLFKTFWDHPVSHLLLLAGTFILMAGLFVLITFLIPEIFFFSKMETMSLQALGKKMIAEIPEVNHIYLIGIINSGKHGKIEATFPKDEHIIHMLDIAWLVSKKPDDQSEQAFDNKWKKIRNDLEAYVTGKNTDKRKRVILIRHFEMQMNDFAITEEKLKILESLLSFVSAARNPEHEAPAGQDAQASKEPAVKIEPGSVKIIISSSRHYDSMPLKLVTVDDKGNKKEKDLSDRWTNVMNNFCTFYHAWDKNDQKVEDQQQLNRRPDDPYLDEIICRIDSECAHSQFLYDLRKPLEEFLLAERHKALEADPTRETKDKMEYGEMNETFDTLCIKLQSIAHHYYLSLWQSLTDDEQRTLYDIASDGLMNQRNNDIADRLFGLGLIEIKENKTGYKVMNQSFRYFVLTRLDKKDLDKLRSDADPSHSWNRIQLPVIIVVIAIGVFLFITQKEAFNNLVTYLGAAAAGIAALLKVLDAFATKKPSAT